MRNIESNRTRKDQNRGYIIWSIIFVLPLLSLSGYISNIGQFLVPRGLWSTFTVGVLYLPCIIAPIALFLNSSKRLRVRKYSLLLIAYCSIVLLRIVYDQYSGGWTIRWTFSSIFLPFLLVACLPMLCNFIEDGRWKVDLYLVSYVFGLIMAANLLMLLLYAAQGDLSGSARFMGDDVDYRFNANGLAVTAAIGALCGLYFLLDLKSKRTYSFIGIIGLYLLLSGIYLIVFSASRGPALAFACVSFYYVIVRANFKVITLAALLLGAFGLFWGFSDTLNVDDIRLINRMKSIEAHSFTVGGSVEARFYFFQLAFDSLFSSLPKALFGEGLSVNLGHSFVHNVFVEAMLIGGVFAFLIFTVLFVVAVYRSLIEIAFIRGELVLFCLIILFLCINLQSTGSFYRAYGFVFLLSMILNQPSERFTVWPGSVSDPRARR